MAGQASSDLRSREDTLGPLKSTRQVLPGDGSNSDLPPPLLKSSSFGRTPPVTPPGRCSSPSSPRLAHSPHSTGSSHMKGIAAPATAVDNVMERWGRPRAHSLSRRERERVSLPAWEEEGDEAGIPLPQKFEDRRRAVSMSAMIPDAGPDRTRAASMPNIWRLERVAQDVDVRYGES